MFKNGIAEALKYIDSREESQVARGSRREATEKSSEFILVNTYLWFRSQH